MEEAIEGSDAVQEADVGALLTERALLQDEDVGGGAFETPIQGAAKKGLLLRESRDRSAEAGVVASSPLVAVEEDEISSLSGKS